MVPMSPWTPVSARLSSRDLCALSPGLFPMSVQAQPDPSSRPHSDQGSAEDKPEASTAPDTHHLWLVSDRGVVVHSDWVGASLGPSPSCLPRTRPAGVGPQEWGCSFSPCGWVCSAAAFWAFWARQPAGQTTLRRGCTGEVLGSLSVRSWGPGPKGSEEEDRSVSLAPGLPQPPWGGTELTTL